MTAAEDAAARLVDRTAEYAARLYRPREYRRLLGDDHPVEGEARGLAQTVHPDDLALAAEVERQRAAEQASWDALYRGAQRREHLIADPVTGEPIHYLRGHAR